MNKDNPKHLKTGVVGEDLAVRFLEDKGFKITNRNYRKKWGEIDIVADKGNVIYFFEVKTLSCETINTNIFYKPEDMVHPWKVKRLMRTIQSYLLEKNMIDKDWKFGIVSILLEENPSAGGKKAHIKLISDIPIY